MAEKTGIAWTRSTFNPWIGCTEVSPGCDACYARELDARHKYGGATHWGVGVPRFRTGAQNWKKPLEWNAIARMEKNSGKVEDGSKWKQPGFYPVFSSMCDPFDNDVPEDYRLDFLDLVMRTKYLTWLLLTKRVSNAGKMLREAIGDSPQPHIWIGASIVNQAEADRDLPKLALVPAARRFISYEPALGPINITRWLREFRKPGDDSSWFTPVPGSHEVRHVHQVIVGGESRQGKHIPRAFRREWASSMLAQCRATQTAFFMKQMGALVVDRNDAGFDGERPTDWPASTSTEESAEHYQGADCRIHLKDRAGANPQEWPEALRIQEFPT